MSTTMEVVYQSALLADAAYVSLDAPLYSAPDGGISDAAFDQGAPDLVTFEDRGFTREQFDEFQLSYRVLHHQPDNDSGFSATLFQHAVTGELHLAFRGTNNAVDLLQDAALATPLAGTFGEWLQNGAAEGFLHAAGLIEASGEILPQYAGRLHLSGHSLGGHLALWTASRHPDLVARVDTFNGAGMSYDNPVVVLMETLWENTIAPQFGAAGFDAARIHNYYGEAGPELIATGMFAYRPGQHVPLFIEEDPGSLLATHDMGALVDSLAAYRLFAAIDPSLSTQDIGAILAASANTAHGSVAEAVRALGASLGAEHAGVSDPLQLYALLEPQLQAGAWAGARIAVSTGTDVGAAVFEETLAGSAWRFAAVNLYPFALIAPAAASVSASPAGLGAEYLLARAYLLESLVLRNTADALTAAEFGRGPEYFRDVARGLDFTSAQAAFPFPPGGAVHYLFGAGGADELAGGDRADQLFGLDGHDTLRGLGGNDALEGGDGNDTLLGVAGDDRLSGGEGDDMLEGGDGNDTLAGGAGADRYVFGGSGGTSVVSDADDGGDRILIATLDMANLGFTETAPRSGMYRDDGDWGISLHRDGDSLYITHGNGENAATVVLGRYVAGAFGIHLPQQESLDEPRNSEPETLRVFSGDRTPVDADPGYPGVQLQYDALGNVLVYPELVEVLDDALFGSIANDLLEAGDGNNVVRARAGDDRLSAGGGEDRLEGEDGDDHLVAGGGRDELGGGEGADWLEGGPDTDILRGDAGDDRLYAGTAADFAHIGDESAAVGADRDWLSGGAGDDTLVGAGGGEALMGGAGADSVAGGAGDDQLMGDADMVATSADWSVSDDTDAQTHVFSPVTGVADAPDAGADTLHGGAGNDWIDAGRAHDLAFGGSGNDSVGGFEGNDTLDGGDGDDRLEGDASVLHLDAGQHGDDQLSGGAGDDQLGGSGGADTLFGGDGDDLMLGDANGLGVAGHGSDRLFGGAGNDTLAGGGGDDLADAGDGLDQLAGGAGRDTLRGGGGDDLLAGDGASVATADQGDDELFGEAGNDQLDGSGGHDGLWGGDGADTLSGGAGSDRLNGGLAADLLDGGADDDALGGDDGDDSLVGGAGSDDLRGSRGQDQLFGQDGNDALRGGSGDDTLSGDGGADKLWALDGNDLAFGGAGDDWLGGGTGNDALYGEAGNDTLDGGAGDDVLAGGDGDDTYVLRAGDGHDTVSDTAGITGLRFGDALGTGALSLVRSSSSSSMTLRFAGASISMPVADYKRLGALSTDAGAFSGAALLNPTAAGESLLLPGTDDSLSALGGSDTVEGGDGHDTLHGDGGYDALLGEGGDDLLAGGADADQLTGGAGADTLDGGAGNDVIDGGAGSDTVLFGPGAGTDQWLAASRTAGELDTLQFGAGVAPGAVALRNYGGNDLYLEAGADVLVVKDYFSNPSSPPPLEIRFADEPATVWRHADILGHFLARAAGAGPDVLEGLAGNDTLDGLGGADLIWGGAGADLLLGGGGQDTLHGGGGADVLDGGEDADSLGGGDGNDRLLGAGEADALDGAAGADTLDGGAGGDQLAGGNDADQLSGGAGNDTLRGGSGADAYFYRPGDGVDLIIERDAYTSGGAATDVLHFGGGITPADIEFAPVLGDLTGFLGYGSFFDRNIAVHLRLPGSAGAVVIAPADDPSAARSRVDEFRFDDAPQSVLAFAQVLAAITSVDDGHDVLEGGAAADVLDARGGNDIAYGADGNDSLAGGIGNDTLLGGAGADTLAGGSGDDFLRGGDDPDPNGGRVDLYVWGAGGGDDTVWARPDSQFWVQGSALAPYPADELQLSGVGWSGLWAERSGDDMSLIVAASGERLTVLGYFASGHNQLRIRNDSAGHWLQADVERKIADTVIQRQVSAGDDLIAGSDTLGDTIDALAGNDRVEGRGGDDSLAGGDGHDLLLGQGGSDTLAGGAGNDTLGGAQGNDSLAGGSGNDAYVFGFGGGLDRLLDADRTTGRFDVIALEADVSPGDLRVARSGDDLVLTLADSGDAITVGRHFLTKGKDIGYHIDALQFADGSLWTRAALADLVSRSASGHYLLNGSDAVDDLAGLGGNDTLNGAGGNDVLRGGAGDDLLRGAAGNDTLLGGKGADVYRFERGDGADLIVDEALSGRVDVLELGAGIQAAGTAAFRTADGDLLLQLGGADSVRVRGFFAGDESPGAGIGELRFADGSAWQRATLEAAAPMPANRAPVAGGDNLGAIEGRALTVTAATLLANDADPDGDPLAVTAALPGFGGSASWNAATGQLVFQPDPYFVGDAWFGYTLSDGRQTVSGRVDVRVAIDAGGTARVGTESADTIAGTRNDDRLYGLGGNDLLRGDRGNDQLFGGRGNDTLEGALGSDTYVFQAGDGAELIDNRSSRSTDVDVLRFGSGVEREDLWFLRDLNDLVIGLAGSADRVVVDEWYASDSARLEEIRVSGEVLYAADVERLVQAMAAFEAPAGTGVVLDDAGRAELEPLLAAAWQAA